MRNKMLWALALLNVLLAATLVGRFARSSQAVAQVRRPADYLMVPGQISGGSAGVIYVVDSTNGLLGAMTYDSSHDELDAMPYIDLNRLFRETEMLPQQQEQPRR